MILEDNLIYINEIKKMKLKVFLFVLLFNLIFVSCGDDDSNPDLDPNSEQTSDDDGSNSDPEESNDNDDSNPDSEQSVGDDSMPTNDVNASFSDIKSQLVGQWQISKRFLKTRDRQVIQETIISGCNELTLLQFNENNTYRENDIFGDNDGRTNCNVNFDESGVFTIVSGSRILFTEENLPVEEADLFVDFRLIGGVLEITLLNEDLGDDEFEVDEFVRVTEPQEFFVP